MKRTRHVTRDTFLVNLTAVKSAINGGLSDADELRRLLDEALHVIVRQQESRRIASRAAAEAMAAADTLVMPNYEF